MLKAANRLLTPAPVNAAQRLHRTPDGRSSRALAEPAYSGNQTLLRQLSHSAQVVRRDPPAPDAKKTAPPAAASPAPGPAPSPTPDAAKTDEVKLTIPWDEILKGNTTLMQVLMPGLQPPAPAAGGAAPAPGAGGAAPAPGAGGASPAPKGPVKVDPAPPPVAPLPAPAGPTPDAPSRLALKDFGNLSLGLRLGFPDLKTDPDPNAPPSALQQAIQTGEIINYDMTGKLPTAYQIDKGKLVGACWGLFSKYVAPDFAAKIAKGMSGKSAGGGISYELDGVLLPDFSGGGVSFTLKFGGGSKKRAPASPDPGPVQPKLKVGSTSDPLEAEADRAADHVMRMPDSATAGTLQRKCAACEEEDKVHTKNNGQAEAEGHAPPIVSQALSSPGQALDAKTRSFFEQRFDADFSQVRLHSDSLAAQSADAVHARAYATGNHIVLGAGESASPSRLLAHELAHVVQQQGPGTTARRTANGSDTQSECNVSLNSPEEQRNAHVRQGTIGIELAPDISQSVPVLRAKPDDPDAGDGGSGNVDPDAKCMGCSPLAKVTKIDKGITYTIGVCSDKFDQLNLGSGDVSIGPGCLPNASNTKGQVGFTAADSSGKQAWDTDAHLADCTSPPPAPNAATPWQIGFIQTLESSTRGGAYDNGNFISVTNSNKRDALTAKDAPWYDSPGNPSGPQIYPTTPHLTDSPIQWFPITHPGTGGKDFLRSGCMNEKFNVWLILNKVGNTPTASNVDFLYHWTISVQQVFLLQGQGAHPCNKSQWLVAGHQTLSNKGPGKGTATPVFTGPIATASATTDTTVKTSPCSAAAQPQNKAPQGGTGQDDKAPDDKTPPDKKQD
jgi:Domain of unknown function (DUF4157)